MSWTMVGLGGIIGSLAGGYLTEADLERWCFFARGMVGLMIALIAMTMPKSIEQDSAERINATMWERTKANARDCWEGFKTVELRKTILYFMLLGACVPNFADFLYYYQIEISGFSQVQFSYLQVLSNVIFFLSCMLYSGLFARFSLRTMLFFACLVNCLGCVTTVAYTT